MSGLPFATVDTWPAAAHAGHVWVTVAHFAERSLDSIRKPIPAAMLHVVLDHLAPGAEIVRRAAAPDFDAELARIKALQPGERFRLVIEHDEPRCHCPGLTHEQCKGFAADPCLEPESAGQRGGEVYFVRAETGQIKIGFSLAAWSRLEALQTGSPVRLQLLTTTPGDQALEHDLHRRFADARLHGEWFRPTPELIALIEEIKNGH